MKRVSYRLINYMNSGVDRECVSTSKELIRVIQEFSDLELWKTGVRDLVISEIPDPEPVDPPGFVDGLPDFTVDDLEWAEHFE